MIYLKVRGRLGNQFFQYATVECYKEKYFPNEEIALDFSDLKRLGTEEDGFVDSLKNFNVPPYKTVDKIDGNALQKLVIFFMKVPNAFLRLIGLKNIADRCTYKFEKFMQPFLNKIGVFYMIHGYCEFHNTKAKNKIFYGNFESSKYFDEIRDNILEMYTPKEPINKDKIELYDKIKNSNSVCITIRRGDFVQNEQFKSIHYICDEKYFYKALEIIKQKINNPLFVVFSDDIKWVKENMDFGSEAIYESGNDSLAEKIREMSMCKNFIISNSTFSWWAQYLSKNDDKIVIAPNEWKKVAYKKDCSKLDIYQDKWIRIDKNGQVV